MLLWIFSTRARAFFPLLLSLVLRAMRQRYLSLTLRLDRDRSPVACARDSDVAQISQQRSAIVVAQPAELGQKDASVGLVELELLGIRIAKTVGVPLLFKAREVAAFSKN